MTSTKPSSCCARTAWRRRRSGPTATTSEGKVRRHGARERRAPSPRSVARPSRSRTTTTSSRTPRTSSTTVFDGGDPASLEDERVKLTAKLGENIQVVGYEADGGRRAARRLVRTSTAPANKVGAIVRTQRRRHGDGAQPCAPPDVRAADVRRRRDEVPQELVDAEREILSRSEEVLSKPENIREKIVEGQLNKKFYGESVLTEQTWYRADESTGTVAQYLKRARGRAPRLRLVRGRLGEAEWRSSASC